MRIYNSPEQYTSAKCSVVIVIGSDFNLFEGRVFISHPPSRICCNLWNPEPAERYPRKAQMDHLHVRFLSGYLLQQRNAREKFRSISRLTIVMRCIYNGSSGTHTYGSFFHGCRNHHHFSSRYYCIWFGGAGREQDNTERTFSIVPSGTIVYKGFHVMC